MATVSRFFSSAGELDRNLQGWRSFRLRGRRDGMNTFVGDMNPYRSTSIWWSPLRCPSTAYSSKFDISGVAKSPKTKSWKFAGLVEKFHRIVFSRNQFREPMIYTNSPRCVTYLLNFRAISIPIKTHSVAPTMHNTDTKTKSMFLPPWVRKNTVTTFLCFWVSSAMTTSSYVVPGIREVEGLWVSMPSWSIKNKLKSPPILRLRKIRSILL